VRVHRRGVGRVVVVLGSGRRVVIVVLGRAAVDRGEVNGAVNEHVRTGREALALAGVHDAVAQAELEVVRLRPRLAVGRDCEHVGGAQRRHVHFQVLYKEACKRRGRCGEATRYGRIGVQSIVLSFARYVLKNIRIFGGSRLGGWDSRWQRKHSPSGCVTL